MIFSIALIALGLDKNEEFLNSPLYNYLSFGLSSFALLIVAVFICKKRNLDFKRSVGIAPCDKKYYLIAILLAFGALFGLGWLNDGFVAFLQKHGFKVAEITLPKRGVGDFILCSVIVCVLPAFFEEIIFRGFLLNGARKGGYIFAVIVCGVLFSLYHKNPAQTVYQLILGAIFAFLTLKSGSILPSMLFHFINNFYIVCYYFIAPEGYVFDLAVQIVLFILAIICFVFTLLYLILKCQYPQKQVELDGEYSKMLCKKEERKSLLIFSLPGVFACLIFWVINLF